MDDCLKVLEREKEHPSDEILVTLVRYQLVGDEAHKLLIRDVIDEGNPTPTYIFRKGLLVRLQEIRDGLAPSLPPSCKSPSNQDQIKIKSSLLADNFKQCCKHTPLLLRSRYTLSDCSC